MTPYGVGRCVPALMSPGGRNAMTTQTKRHVWMWDTFPGDVMGPCPEGCTHQHVVGRVCRYCWTTFAPSRSESMFCSSECHDRSAAWDAWVRETRSAAIYGRRGPAAPAGGRGLGASVSRFQLELVPA